MLKSNPGQHSLLQRWREQQVSPDTIPAILKGIPKWVAWKAFTENSNGSFNKVPVDPRRGTKVNAHDQCNQHVFAEVFSACQAGIADGVGIVLDGEPIASSDDGAPLYLVGVDLDKITTSEASEAAKEVWDELSGYRELNPSGRGVRIFVLNREKTHSGQCPHGEMCSDKRFLTVTGWQSRGELVERTHEIKGLEQRWWPNKRAAAPSSIFQFPSTEKAFGIFGSQKLRKR